MKTKTENPLPKMMPGSIHAKYVRCGKRTCKCARGQLHGAYYYRLWREGGCLHKEYVRAVDVEGTRAACDARRLAEKQQRLIKQTNKQQLRELVARIRENESLLTAFLGMK